MRARAGLPVIGEPSANLLPLSRQDRHVFPTDLGARVDGGFVDFALWAPSAQSVQVAYIDGETSALIPAGGGVWRATVPGRQAGYFFLVDGVRVLDPYARRIEFAGGEPVSFAVDDAPLDTVRPKIPWPDTVIYEAHVRGLTMLNRDVPSSLRGSYLGVSHPAVVAHLKRLGVTAIELMPVQQFITEPAVASRGLSNYWGYNPIGYFAPHAAYSSIEGNQNIEFKQMVAEFHAAGLEVIVDVVYNHTGEGGPGGPDYHLRTLDESGYYLLDDGTYADFSGCGNTLRSDTAPARDLVLSSLRHWAREYGVDGFRFDLASTLARNSTGAIVYSGSLVEAIAQDEELAALKLIAEPWDAGADGYALGGFGGSFAQWNDRFRDDVRNYWRGTSGGVHHLASRLAGSSDLFADHSPMASINFVTSHDEFSLRDLVTYGSKHNDANGEDGRDGHDDNCSDGCGAEGETEDRAIIAQRQQRARNLVSTVMLSLGTPMIRMGDEFGHTQGGNNNAYCQDNEISWMSWVADEGWDLCDHLAALSALRRDNVEFRRDRFLTDADVTWLRDDDTPMTEADWANAALTFLGMRTGRISHRIDSKGSSFSLMDDAGGESLLNLRP